MRTKLRIPVCILLLLILTSTTVFAASNHYMDYGDSSKTLYYTPEFYNTRSTMLNIYVQSSSFSRTFTFELQRKTLSGTWEVMQTKNGTISAGSVYSDNWTFSNPSGATGDFRYKLTFSSPSTFDGYVRHYY